MKQVVEAWAEDSLDLRRFQSKRVSVFFLFFFLRVGLLCRLHCNC